MDTPETDPAETDPAEASPERRAAVEYFAAVVEIFIYDRCVGADEYDAESAALVRHLRALGVTDAEIEAWT